MNSVKYEKKIIMTYISVAIIVADIVVDLLFKGKVITHWSAIWEQRFGFWN